MDEKLEILVVDDNEIHQEAAKQLLEGHNVTVAKAFDYAMDMLNSDAKYDVLLTDLLFPQGRGEMQGTEGRYLAKDDMAFGFPLALIAAKKGIKNIAIVTDMNHHDHPMAYTFDFFKGEDYNPMRFRIQDSTCMMFDSRDLPSTQGYEGSAVRPKNWKAALDILLGGEK